MAAVVAAGGCSGGPPAPPPPPSPPCLLLSLPQEHQAAPMEVSVASPHLGASPVSWPFCWPLAALHNSGTVSGSYCARDRVTSQTLGPVLCMPLLKRFLHSACVRAFCRVTEFLWPFQLQRTSFLFLSVWPCWKLPAFAHFCAFIRQLESIRVVHLILRVLPEFLFELLSCTTEFGSPDNSQTPTGHTGNILRRVLFAKFRVCGIWILWTSQPMPCWC